jgi:hypothetical protein
MQNSTLLNYSQRSRRAQDGFLQPAPAWCAILALFGLTIFLSLAGQGSVVRIFFPVASFAVGLLLYLRYPILYVGFTWWIWMLTPFLARLADYRSSWDPQRLMISATFLVTLIPVVTLAKNSPKLIQQGAAPFLISTMAVMYGVSIGTFHASTYAIARNLLDWLSPIVFGLYIFSKSSTYPELQQNIRHVFLWGVAVTGAYGIYQYVVAPEWDRVWLTQSGMFTSCGNPEPYEMRIWSTMHSPGPFSCLLIAGLLLSFSSSSRFAPVSNIFGYTAFLLTLVRTAWGSWFIGLIFLLTSVKSEIQVKLVSYVVVMIVIVVPIISISPFADSIGARMQTLGSLSSDSSFNARQGIYDNGLSEALSNVMGNGLGGAWNSQGDVLTQNVIDSGILDVLRTLGWIGTVPYFSGLIILYVRVLASSSAKSDTFLSASRAISLCFLLQMIMGTAVIGFPGLMVWSFLGLSLCGDQFYKKSKLRSA